MGHYYCLYFTDEENFLEQSYELGDSEVIDVSYKAIMSGKYHMPLLWLAFLKDSTVFKKQVSIKQQLAESDAEAQNEEEHAEIFGVKLTISTAIKKLEECLPYFNYILSDHGSLDEWVELFIGILTKVNYQFVYLDLSDFRGFYKSDEEFLASFNDVCGYFNDTILSSSAEQKLVLKEALFQLTSIQLEENIGIRAYLPTLLGGRKPALQRFNAENISEDNIWYLFGDLAEYKQWLPKTGKLAEKRAFPDDNEIEEPIKNLKLEMS